MTTVVLGTVKGDLHDIGKNLARIMMEGAGCKVHDLGVDVPPERFVEKVKELKPDILGMSALLSVTIDKVRETIEALIKNSLRDDVRILIGGRCLDENLYV